MQVFSCFSLPFFLFLFFSPQLLHRGSLDMLGFVSNELPAGWDAVPFQSNYSGRNLQQALNMPTPPPPHIGLRSCCLC